jgi:translation initiation factor 1
MMTERWGISTPHIAHGRLATHRAMAKKKAPPATVPVGEANALTHSPFASLRAAVTSVAPEPSAIAAHDPAEPAQAPQRWRGRLIMQRETKHRGGKVVLVIRGFDAIAGLDESALDGLAKELKRVLGCGGSAGAGEILLQGDQPAKVAELLRGKGFRVDGVTS